MILEQGIQSKAENAELKVYGCFFYDILKYCEVQGRKLPDTPEKILLKAKACGFVGDDAMVLSQQGLYPILQRLPALVYHKASKLPESQELYITEKTKMSKQGQLLTHFTLVIDGTEWDSLDPKRASNTGYTVKSYRWWA